LAQRGGAACGSYRATDILLDKGETHLAQGVVRALTSDERRFGAYLLGPMEMRAACHPSLKTVADRFCVGVAHQVRANLLSMQRPFAAATHVLATD
jgi:hypothetical protein